MPWVVKLQDPIPRWEDEGGAVREAVPPKLGEDLEYVDHTGPIATWTWWGVKCAHYPLFVSGLEMLKRETGSGI